MFVEGIDQTLDPLAMLYVRRTNVYDNMHIGQPNNKTTDHSGILNQAIDFFQCYKNKSNQRNIGYKTHTGVNTETNLKKQSIIHLIHLYQIMPSHHHTLYCIDYQ